ncbi:hypothetical protein BDW72DRAFT_212314 [Aspergillus terricola var. indicus]
MAGITQDRAREIITEIYNQSGGFLTDDEQQGVLANVLGAPVREAAARAWTSNTRFVYEMIQNAEDCSYKSAVSEIAIPSLRFEVLPDRIVVDSNEDGFDESHVRAICSAGKRTKEGKLGEKGIGFKSVFKIASKVRIQSGPFCFSLRRRNGENGLGMIAPVNELHEVLPAWVRTRFTLFSCPEQCREIEAELLSMPHTIIAFLSRIGRLSFYFSTSCTPLIFSRPTIEPNLVCLETRPSTVVVNKYFPFRKKVTGLPLRESRPLTEDVEMVLAFPLDDQALTTQPFAHSYRPLRGAGLNFLVQSDFVTQDNGEDLAACAWNDHLLGSLPGVFLAALQELCSIPELENIWPRFLPDDKIKGSPWSPFYESLLRDLKHIPVFKTRRGTLKSLEEVRYLLPEHCDSNGKPLFEDLQEDIYLSPQYADYYDLLEPFGLQPVSSRQLLDRLRPYLESPQPRFLVDTFSESLVFGKRLYEDWHTKVADLLLSWLNCPQDLAVAKQVEHLQIVPVSNGYKSTFLKSPKDMAIYFPHDASGNLIPSGIVDVVPVSEVVNVARVRLFKRLGVKRAVPSFVVEQICNWNTRIAERPSLEESIFNLKYIYVVAPSRNAVNAKCTFLYDSDGKELEMPYYEVSEWKRAEDLYFKNNDGYGMDAVVQVLQHRCSHKMDLLRPKFLHPAYTAGFSSNDPWLKWLGEVGSIRQAPRLELPGPAPQPSRILQLVVNYAPDILISMLKDNWNVYAVELASADPSTLSEIREAIVPVDCGTEALERSFLGTHERRYLWSGTYLKDEFPFLKTPSNRENDDLEDWDFLAQFGVGTTTPEFLVASAKKLSTMPLCHAKDGFFKLYELLADNYYEEFWDYPTPTAIVYLPQSGSDGKLVRLADCVWDDDFPCGKHVLGSHEQYLQSLKVKQMFQRALGSQNTNYAAFLSKLSWLQGQNFTSRDSVYRIYKAIMEGPWSEQDWPIIRAHFESRKLIYIPHEDSWIPSTICVWSAFPFTNGQYAIRHIYPGLEDLFVDRLRVDVPDIGSYVEKICFMAPEDSIISETLVVLKELSSLRPTANDLKLLKLVKFLPVRKGTNHIVFAKVDDPYFIVDDDRLQVDARVPVLDFTPEDVCCLRGFFSALGLQERYVSSQLTDTTVVTSNADKSAELTHDLRQRAQSLLRCTIHYGSRASIRPYGKVQEIFSQATVYTTENISRHFNLGDGLETETSYRGQSHLEKIDGSLRVFVPRDERQRAICYATELPRAFVLYLGIDDRMACGTFATVLREPLDILDAILNEMGIIHPAMDQPEELIIRTKNQAESGEISSISNASLNGTRPVQQSLLIKLKASEEYMEKQASGLKYLTSPTKSYNIADEYAEYNSSNIIVSYYKSKPQDRGLTIIDAALKAAAESPNTSQLAHLLDHIGTQGHSVTVSQGALEAAAANEICGQSILSLLLEFSESLGQIARELEMDAILKPAAENEECGWEVTELLLHYMKLQNQKVTVTDAVLKAAAENSESSDALLAILLEHDHDPVTEDIVLAAAMNEDTGYQTMSLLLDYDCDIWISPAIFKAAARNLHQGPQLMTILLRQNGENFRVTEDIIIAAAHNDASGLEVLSLLKQHNGGYLPVTEAILLAAAESENIQEIMGLFLELYDWDLPITNDVFEVAARNPALGKENLACLLDNLAYPQITKEIMVAAIPDSEKLNLLRTHSDCNRLAFFEAAAGSLEWCLEMPLLDELSDSITDSVLEAAAANPVHGCNAISLLLKLCSQDHKISQGTFLAAARNPRSGEDILDLLLERQPDVQITAELIAAATTADNRTLEQLIRHITQKQPSTTISSLIQMTESFLEAVSGNWNCGGSVLHLLLDTRTEHDDPIPVTQTALINGASNIQCGFEVMEILLDHGGPDLENLITEDVLIAAAGNSLWALEILALLLYQEFTIPFSMDVFAAAEHNIWCGEEILALLLKHQALSAEYTDADSSDDEDFCDYTDTEESENHYNVDSDADL